MSVFGIIVIILVVTTEGKENPTAGVGWYYPKLGQLL